VKDINCEVWVGQRIDENGNQIIVEWYFMAENWISVEKGGFSGRELISITVTSYNDQNEKSTTFYYFNNFDSTINDRFDFGITECETEFNHTHYAFSLRADESVAVYDLKDFKTSLVTDIQNIAGVKMMRIGNFDVN
jgi:hypothetical protein